MKDKRGVSPVIATVLLILIVVILAIIILLWAKGFVREVVSKDIGGVEKNAEEVCREISLNPSINEEGAIIIENTGQIPVYKLKLKLEDSSSGRTSTEEVSLVDEGTLNPGKKSLINDKDYSTYTSIEAIPILLATSKGKKKEFQCPEENAIEIK